MLDTIVQNCDSLVNFQICTSFQIQKLAASSMCSKHSAMSEFEQCEG